QVLAAIDGRLPGMSGVGPGFAVDADVLLEDPHIPGTPDSPISRCRSFNLPTTVSGEPMNTEPRNVSSSVISVRRCEVFQRGCSGGLFCRREESASRRLWFWKCRISVGP